MLKALSLLEHVSVSGHPVSPSTRVQTRVQRSDRNYKPPGDVQDVNLSECGSWVMQLRFITD